MRVMRAMRVNKRAIIRELHDIHGVWREVANEAGVSYEGDISIPWQLTRHLVRESLTLKFQMQDFVKLLKRYFK